MFNKYRGQPQIKIMNRSSEKEALIRKPQPKPAAKEDFEDVSVIAAIDDAAETMEQLDVENEKFRQQEEDEWFRQFKGEPEPKEEVEPVTEETSEEEMPGSTEDSVSEQEIVAEEVEPVCEDQEEETAGKTEQSEDSFMEPDEAEETENPEVTDNEAHPEKVEETTREAEELQEEPEETASPEVPSIPEESETAISAEKPELSSEEDDEKWIQDLLSDIQEKKKSVSDEESEQTEFAPPMSIEENDPEDILETLDESDWYRSTPLLRTAALIVLDLTESEEEEEYIEETPEDEASYETASDLPEDEPVSDPEEQPDPIDESSEEESKTVLEEVTIDDVDEKLATLMDDVPESELDMEAVLDNMDRIIQETEPTPVRFVQEPVPAPTSRTRANPNRNRKKKKKKR